MPSPIASPRWYVYVLALVMTSVTLVAFKGAIAGYAQPFAGVMVDPDLRVSSVGLPTWDGIRQGLQFPDRIVEVDGEDLTRPPVSGYRGAVWERAVARAAAEHRASVHVRVETRAGVRELDLAIEPLDALAWWLIAGIPILVGALYVMSALVALIASPDGLLARTFAKTALASGALLITFFDHHASRELVPIGEIGFCLVPMGFAALALRIPDDAPVLRRFPWFERALDACGVALAFSMIALHRAGHATTALREVATLLFAASQFFFVVAILVRFVVARAARRAKLKTLFGAMLVAHVPVGVVAVLAMMSAKGSTIAFFIIPALALSPISTAVAFVRHDLWASDALLSRVTTRIVVGIIAATLAIAAGAALAASVGGSFKSALLAAAAGGVAAAVLVPAALAASDRGIFNARAEYKPTIEQLSEELTAIDHPAEVASAVERTVRRWLHCDRVAFVAAPARAADATDVAASIYSVEPLVSDGAARQIAIDVRFRGETLGALHVGQKRGGALFTSDDVDLLRTIANQAALALAHAHAYAELERRRKEQAAAWRDERASIVETVAAEIAHEVRYPINFFRSVFGKGPRALDEEEIDIGREEVDRLERLVAGLRRVAGHRLERRVVSLADVAARAEMLLRDSLAGRSLSIDVPTVVAVRCDPDQITQVLVNLVANALEATQPTDDVGVRWTPDPSGGKLIVWDRGPGFAADVSQLFAPWFTTKARGTGLGLAITHRLVRSHGWDIDAGRSAGATEFVIAIPAADLVESQTQLENEVA